MRTVAFLCVAMFLPSLPAYAQKGKAIGWEKTVLDKVFRAEGVCVADFNNDGKLDVFNGEAWYEAPSWKMHVVRNPKPYNPAAYSESFACFPGDFNGDDWMDCVVIPFPGKQCFWYENPGKKGGKWAEHPVATSACNETPIYIDLFKTGKKVVVMGWQPEGKNNMGEMCWFSPGKDPTKLWEKHSISGPSGKEKGKEVPGTQKFSHGLGHGDVNGDGRIDIITSGAPFAAGGWWEQPAKIDATPWKFHPASLGVACADMYAIDVNGDGKNDIVSTSAHKYGFWCHLQKGEKGGSPLFSTTDIFLSPPAKADSMMKALEKSLPLGKEEAAFYAAWRKVRDDQNKAVHPLDAKLVTLARQSAEVLAQDKPLPAFAEGSGLYRIVLNLATLPAPEDVTKSLLTGKDAAIENLRPGNALGVGFARGDRGSFYVAILGKGDFALNSETHALIHTDINGDGLADLVTGRRWWSHGARGEPGSADPAVVTWYQAVKNKDGSITYIPHEIDDDSGIGTQFVVVDIDGDGLPDIIVSNKKGTFIHRQVRLGTLPEPRGKD